MLEEPTSLRIDDPGVRALFTEAARFQSWLDVEAALAHAQGALGIIPGHHACARDRAGEGDAGGYVHWGATTQNITQTGLLLQVRRAHQIFLRQLGAILGPLGGLAARTKDR